MYETLARLKIREIREICGRKELQKVELTLISHNFLLRRNYPPHGAFASQPADGVGQELGSL